MRAKQAQENALYQLLARREFLAVAGGALIAAGAFVMEGCGGGGGGATGSGGGTRAVKGSIQFPTGFAANIGALTVSNGLGTSTVAANKTFTAMGISTGPSLVFVQDSTGRAIFTGFINSTAQSNVIGALSTAAALVYFGFDAYMMPENQRSLLVKLIQQHSATIAFSKVIEQRVLANSFALDQTDAQISAALKTASAAVMAPGSKAIQRITNSITRDAPPLIQIQPNVPQSGFEVLLDPNGAGYFCTNHYRRYCKAYTYKTGTVDLTGKETDLPTALLVNGPTSVTSTRNLSLGTALSDAPGALAAWWQGGGAASNSAYTPVSSPVIPLPLDAGVSKDLYSIVVLGSTFSQDDPPVYKNAIYANEVAGWRTAVTSLTLKSWFEDILFALLLDALGVRQIIADDIAIDAAIAGLTTLENAAWQTAIARAEQGLFGDAAQYAMQSIVADDLVANACFGALLKVIGSAEAAAALAVKKATFKTYVGVVLRALLNITIAAFGALGTGDMASVSADLTLANPADVWNAVVVRQTLILSPTSATIAPGARVTFSVKPPTGLTGTISYHWTQNGKFSTLSSSDGTVGNSIDTTSTSVDLVTTPSDQSNIGNCQ